MLTYYKNRPLAGQSVRNRLFTIAECYTLLRRVSAARIVCFHCAPGASASTSSSEAMTAMTATTASTVRGSMLTHPTSYASVRQHVQRTSRIARKAACSKDISWGKEKAATRLEKEKISRYCKQPTRVRYASARELSATQKHCLQKFINLCMKDGKKNKSYKIISNTLWRLAISEGATLSKVSGSLILLMNAIENVKPIIEVKKVRISGTTQLVPSILSKNRQRSLAIRWILEAAILRRNTKKSLTLDQCLFAELMDAFHNIGTVRKRRDDLHKLAESNRGFAHYRWW